MAEIVAHGVLYFLYLPFGQDPVARDQLKDHIQSHKAWLAAQGDAAESGGSPTPTALYILWEAVRSLPAHVEEVSDLARLREVNSGWVYRYADPVMVFGVLPVGFVFSGLVFSGAAGIAAGAGATLTVWGELVRRLRRVTHRSEHFTDAPNESLVTLPNVITLLRLVGIGMFPLLFYRGGNLQALVVLGLLASSDWLDGFVARSTGSVSRVGTMFDPTVDRMMMTAVVLTMTVSGYLPPLLGALMAMREVFVMTFGLTVLLPRERAGRRALAVHWTGKVALALSVGGLLVLLSAPPAPKIVSELFGVVLCVVGLAFGLAATFRYVREALQS